MIFCTQCGHKNVADARFCEECGNPLVKRVAAPAAGPVAPVSAAAACPAPAAAVPLAPRPVNRRLLSFVALGVAAVLALGAGLFFLLAPEAPSNERFAAAIERSLAGKAQDYKAHYCLNNFAYNLDPVLVNEQDQATRQWLAVLTKGGLYSEPELIEDTTGYFVVRKLRYSKTEAGKKATQDRLLCVADGVSVARVERFTAPEKIGDTQAARATVTLKLRNPMPWAMTEEAQSMVAQLQPEFSQDIVMVLNDGKWDVADQRALQIAIAAERQQGARQKANEAGAAGGGMFDALKRLFSLGASNPIIGKWSSEMMGVTVAAFEFESDAMLTNGQKTPVRYEVEGQRVTVYPQGEGSGMVVNVVDHDTLSIDTGLVQLKLKRAH